MTGAHTPPKRSGGGLTTLLAGILSLVAAGLAIGGSFGPISTFRNSYEGDGDGDATVYASETTWWGYGDAGSTNPIDDGNILNGLVLVLVAALLVLGAVFAFVAARTRTPGPTTGARSLVSAGVGALAGAALLQVLELLAQTDSYNERELEAGESLEFTPGLGLWLPVGALVVGLVAAVLVHVGRRQVGARVEPNTPRMGFRAPYGGYGQQRMAPAMPVAQQKPLTEAEAENAGETTQRVSGATAGGATPAATDSPGGSHAAHTPAATHAPATPAAVAADSPSAPAAPEAPSAPASPATPDSPAAPATPAAPEAPAAPATADAPAAPAAPRAPEAPASPAAPAAPEAPTPAAAPETPAAPEAPATPAATGPASDGPAGERTPLTDLPAAPPAPELSSSDEPRKTDG